MPATPVFALTLRVPDGDVDRQGHVNNVAFVRYVQEVAVAHWRAVAPPEAQAALAWVVRRHEVEYLRPGLPGDELVLRTWVGEEPSGARWERFTEVVRAGEEKPIVTARTVWVLLDAATGRPRRVGAALAARFTGTRSEDSSAS
jgi:acyl-CoA thioester hydrolase